MKDRDLSPLEQDVRALLERAAVVQSAPVAAKERVLARVEALVQSPGGGGGGGTSRRASASSLAPQARVLRRLFPFAATFVLGGGVGAVLARATMHPPVPIVVYREAPRATASPASAPSPAVAPPPASAVLLRVPAAGTPPLPSSTAGGQLAAERALLDIARGALEREEPGAALSAIAQHERRYASGILVQEREAMAVRALAMAGRLQEARTRAEHFRGRFPESILLPTLQATLGGAKEP